MGFWRCAPARYTAVSSVIIFLFLCLLLFNVYYCTTGISLRLDDDSWPTTQKCSCYNNEIKRNKLTAGGPLSSSTDNEEKTLQHPQHKQPQSLYSFFRTNYTSEKFSIIIPTYKRNYCVFSSLRHYCKINHVATILVLWNNVGEDIPRYIKRMPCKAELKYMKMSEKRQTARFILYPEIQTEAILSLDDHEIVSEDSLMLAYSAWKQFRHKIVGFSSRTYSMDSKERLIYQEEKSFPYSMVLTNAAFVHRKYFEMFTTSFPRELYNFVDDHMEADGIAMNVMVADFLSKANEPQCSGLLVNGNMTECRMTGNKSQTSLWKLGNDTNAVRTKFLRLVSQSYNYMPLVECDIAISQPTNTH